MNMSLVVKLSEKWVESMCYRAYDFAYFVHCALVVFGLKV